MSTFDQDVALQRAAFEAAGWRVVRAETASGTRRDGWTELQALLDFLQSSAAARVRGHAGAGAQGARCKE